MRRMGVALLGLAVLLASSLPLAAQTAGKAWSEKWKAENKQWIAQHLIGLQPDRLDAAKRLVVEGLAPLGFNALIVEIDYSFQFKSHPELEAKGLNKTQVRELVEACRKHGIRVIPLMNCLGHQSWGARPGALLKKYPQFDETPWIPQSDKKIYCREWCPSHPDVNKVVFDLLDELIDAFDADAMHVGMDEVFLIGDKNCPRCKDKEVSDLFAKVVCDLHDHLVNQKGVEMLMWSDRLLDSKATGYGTWEASATGSHAAIERVPKDIIMCDWHYTKRAEYPSIPIFIERGFRVWPGGWHDVPATEALMDYAQKHAGEKMLGHLCTVWGRVPVGKLADFPPIGVAAKKLGVSSPAAK